MIHNPAEILEQGCAILDGVLCSYGFKREKVVSGKGSGGHFASTSYVLGNRKLELHFRFSFGLVTYHFDSVSVNHEELMKAILGTKGGNNYPGFSDVPADSFRGLARDLEAFAGPFLTGDGPEFNRYAAIAREQRLLTGFARLAESEG